MQGLVFLILFLISGCSENHFKEGKTFAGGIYASAEALNSGKTTYTEYCMPCHGVNGDGKGPSAKGLQIPPRNLKLGMYKFGRVVPGELPHDEDFYKILKEGLEGTAMLPWKDLSPVQLFNLVQYMKTFAPEQWEGKERKLGVTIVPTRDPFKDDKAGAIERGKAVYHIVARCWLCHRAYVSHAEYSKLNEKINGKPETEFNTEMYRLKLQPNDYDSASVPPEFTYDPIRSAKNLEELYVRISAGVAGTSMPSWKGTLPDEDIWAVTYYVKYLMDFKNSPARKELLESSLK